MLLVSATAYGQGQRAAFVARFQDRLWLLDQGGKPLRKLPVGLAGIGSVSIDSAARYGVGVSGRCAGDNAGELREFETTKPASRPLKLPRPLFPSSLPQDEREVFADPAVSPSGEVVAFVVRPCNPEHHLDAVEGAGVVATYERSTGRAQVLAGGVTPDGVPAGYAWSPTWSDDGKLLFVNFETGFRVLRFSVGAMQAEPPVTMPDLWNSAVGWMGSRCVVYVEGKDRLAAENNPRMVLNVFTGKARLLSDIVGSGGATFRGFQVRWPDAVLNDRGQISIYTFRTSGQHNRRTLGPGITAVQFLPGSPVSLPAFCR